MLKDNVELTESSFKRVIEAALHLLYNGDDPDMFGLTYKEVIALRLVKKAATEGDLRAFDRIADRTEGKPKQTQEFIHTERTYVDYLKEIGRKEYGDDFIESSTLDEGELPLLRSERSETKEQSRGADPFHIE